MEISSPSRFSHAPTDHHSTLTCTSTNMFQGSFHFCIVRAKDLEVGGSAILDAYHERQAGTHNDGALMHTTVSARLVDATTGTVVLEVFPFLVRTSLTSTQADMYDWVGTVRDELAAGVHPAPCALYARRVSKGVDTAVPISGADVLSAAKALLGGDPSSISPSVPISISDANVLVSANALLQHHTSRSPLVPSLQFMLSLTVVCKSIIRTATPLTSLSQDNQPCQKNNEDRINDDDDEHLKIRDALAEKAYVIAMRRYAQSLLDPSMLTRKFSEMCSVMPVASLQILLNDTRMVEDIVARIEDEASDVRQTQQELGEKLYTLIDDFGIPNTGKITGMLLELDYTEIVELTTNMGALMARVTEAAEVLMEHELRHEQCPEQSVPQPHCRPPRRRTR